MTLPPLLENLARLALLAGREVMDIYAGPVEVQTKADDSPLTAADLASESVILSGLAKLEPDTPVISEEDSQGGARASAAPRFFLVDPLDGTKEFISRNGEFTINIALIENGHPSAGVVYAPALSRMFCGQTGAGSFEAAISPRDTLPDNQWRNISAGPVPAAAKRVVASRSHRDARTQAWLAERDIAKIVSAGSSLKFCLIAAGEADIYPRFGRTMEWDTAAGHAVLAAAGGKVDTEDGPPLVYGKQERGFDNPGFIASGR